MSSDYDNPQELSTTGKKCLGERPGGKARNSLTRVGTFQSCALAVATRIRGDCCTLPGAGRGRQGGVRRNLTIYFSCGAGDQGLTTEPPDGIPDAESKTLAPLRGAFLSLRLPVVSQNPLYHRLQAVIPPGIKGA